MYNIADFLLVQLSLSRFTLIKSAWSSHVCIYISTTQFYQSDDQNIRCHHNISHYLIVGNQICNCYVQKRNMCKFWLSGIFSADNRRLIRLSAMAEGSKRMIFPGNQPRLCPKGTGHSISKILANPYLCTWFDLEWPKFTKFGVITNGGVANVIKTAGISQSK